MRLIKLVFGVSALVAAGCSGDDSAVDHTESAPAASDTQKFPDPSVTYLQQALTEVGYDVGAVDGFYGPATSDAVAEFQADQGLEPTTPGQPRGTVVDRQDPT